MNTAPSTLVIPSKYSLVGRSRWVIALMSINVVAYAGVATYGAFATRHARRDQLISDPGFLGTVGVSGFTMMVGTVAFLLWLWRAYANLSALGISTRRFSQGWTIGVWFVPIAASLVGGVMGAVGVIVIAAGFIPSLLLISDLDRGSDPDANSERDGQWWKEHSISLLVWAWWTSWLVGRIADGIAQTFIQPKEGYKPDPDDSLSIVIRDMFNLPLNDRFWLVLVVMGISMMISGICGVLLVRRVARNQVDRFARHGIHEQIVAPPQAPSPIPSLPDLPIEPLNVITVPERAADDEMRGQIEDGVEGGVWMNVPRACEMVIQVTTIDQTALQIEVADEHRSWIDVVQPREPEYATSLTVDEPTQRFIRVVDPSGGERPWTMRVWFEQLDA